MNIINTELEFCSGGITGKVYKPLVVVVYVNPFGSRLHLHFSCVPSTSLQRIVSVMHSQLTEKGLDHVHLLKSWAHFITVLGKVS